MKKVKQKNQQLNSSINQLAKFIIPRQQRLLIKGGGEGEGDASIIIEDLIDD